MRLGRAFWRFAMVASLAVAVTLPVMAQARFGGPGSEASLPDGASSSTSPSTSTPDPGSIVIQPEIPERGTSSPSGWTAILASSRISQMRMTKPCVRLSA